MVKYITRCPNCTSVFAYEPVQICGTAAAKCPLCDCASKHHGFKTVRQLEEYENGGKQNGTDEHAPVGAV